MPESITYSGTRYLTTVRGCVITARFISEDTVVVSQCTGQSQCRPGDGDNGSLYDAAAKMIADAGFKVIRDPIEGEVKFRDAVFDTDYLNQLVGNGFVITVRFGDTELDATAKKRIESCFPGREVCVVEMLASRYAGDGVHCPANDQPLIEVGVNQ